MDMERRKIDFAQLSNAEINIRKQALENEHETKKGEIIKLIHQLEELDVLFIEANEELGRRGLLE